MNGPPLRLPGEHFIAALCFLLTGAIGVVWIAPALAAGGYPLPRVIGVAHLFTLGWLTTSIMGALYQFLPVALGEAIASERVAHLTFVLYVPGVSVFVFGLTQGVARLVLPGAFALGVGLLLFLANLAVTLHRAQQRDVTWWALALAAAFLGVTVVLGLTLAVNTQAGFLGEVRPLAVSTHLHVALVGWVLLVMVGVSQRLLPMFLLSHGAPDHLARVAVACIATGAAMLSLLHHIPVVGRELPAFSIASGLLAYLWQTRLFYRHRHRPALDPALRLTAGALLLLALGVPFAAVILTRDVLPHVLTAYAMLLILACSLFIAAHYYKIVPFLVWNRYFGPLTGTRPLPRVADLYSSHLATGVVSLLVLGAITLTASVTARVVGGVHAGALIFAGGVAIEAGQMVGIARRRP